jgi:hypothetical protein
MKSKKEYYFAMITVLSTGTYQLYKKDPLRILTLNGKKKFLWEKSRDATGQLRFWTPQDNIEELSASGAFRLYDVKKETDLTDGMHLELFVGEGDWEGYLLKDKLPNAKRKECDIVKTDECITKCAC